MALLGVSGAVLAGGRSSRFGEDKARFVWHGQTLLEHALDGLSVCAERFVVGGGWAPVGVPLHPDLEPFAGGLHGLARALELAHRPRVAVTACDMPLLSSAYWSWLAELGSADVILPENASGRLEPFAALYSGACLPVARAAIQIGRLKLTGWWQGSGLEVVTVPWLEVSARFGVNLFLNANDRAALEIQGSVSGSRSNC